MKPPYPARLVMVSFCLCAMFLSCTKPKRCPDAPSSLIINHNGPIYPGWPLYLESEFGSANYLYKWTGPDGWKQHYRTFASDAYMQMRDSMSTAEAGEYTLQLIDHEGCVAYEGSTTVEVVPAPPPPCTVAANSSASSVVGVGDYSFNYRNFGGSGDYYFASGSEVVPGGHYMRFAFLGDDPPLPGVYKTESFFATEPDRVGLYIETITYQFVPEPNQKVYVNKVNNKLEISFCSLKFGNPFNPASPIIISAKLIQP